VPAPLPEIAARVGEWIRTYQAVTAAEGTWAIDERREYLDVRLRRLVAATVIPAEEREAVLAVFDGLAAAIGNGDRALTAIHADLCPPNILVAPDGQVTILDFAMAKTGARLHDLSHLYLHLEFQSWRPRPHRGMMAETKRRLLDGYQPGLTPDDPVFRLFLLQHTVCHVALLSEQAAGALQPARLWLARRRWLRCRRSDALGLPAAAGRLATAR
jgi:hypothetical protein